MLERSPSAARRAIALRLRQRPTLATAVNSSGLWGSVLVGLAPEQLVLQREAGLRGGQLGDVSSSMARLDGPLSA